MGKIVADPISVDSYLAELARTYRVSFAQWSRMPPEVWAEEVFRLQEGRRFRWSYAPYSREMFLSLFEPRVIESCFQLYSRGLKSTVILMAIGYFIDQAPRKILSLWPTNSQGGKWSKDCLTGELLDVVPVLNQFGSAAKKRTGSNTLLHKTGPGWLVDIFGANAPGDMRRAKGNFLYGDEIDAIEATSTDEGDQLQIFRKRGDEYPDTIRVFASYPSLKGHSRINSLLEQSDFRKWFAVCVKCGGEPFVMHRNQLRYDPEKPQEVRFECPRCKELLTDGERDVMAKAGAWKATKEFRGYRGYQANSMLWPHPVDLQKYPGGFLQLLAEKEIAVKRSENPSRAMKPLVNTEDAEPFDPQSEEEKPPEWKPLFDRREDYAAIPAGMLVLTGAADIQLNRIEVEWKAWGRNEVSAGMLHTVIDGDVRDPAVWGLLKRELQRKFLNVDGVEIPFSLFFIDGGKWPDRVLSFLGDLARNPIPGVSGKVRAVKGFGAATHPVVSDWRAISKNMKGYHIGTWQIKDMLNRRIVMTWNGEGDPPQGWMRWNKVYSENYFRQLCTGKCTVEYKGGEEIRKYVAVEQVRDEALDLSVYNYAAFRRRNWPFDLIEAEIERKAAAIREKKPLELKKPRLKRVENGLMSGFGGNSW